MIEDTFPRIIDDDLWLRVQAACKARTGRGGHKLNTRVNLLAGIGRCAECQGNMRINPHGRTGHRYYECTKHAVLRTCSNRCRYRVDVIEVARLHRFGLGWLELVQAIKSAASDLMALREGAARLKAREKRLASHLQELDDDEMYDEVMEQLRELRGKRIDAETRLSAAQQAAAVAKAPARIGDISDRPALATALQQLLVEVKFYNSSRVELHSQRAMLTVIARQNAPKLALAFKISEHHHKVVWRAGSGRTATDRAEQASDPEQAEITWITVSSPSS